MSWVENIDDLMQDLSSEERTLVLRFFVAFSRFEYALKRAGFCGGRENGRARADWGKFAQENVRPLDSEDPELREAVNYLLANAPREQRVQDERPIFVDGHRYGEGKDTDFEKIVDIVKGVRNNLFHGGKFHCGVIAGSERDKCLIRSAMQVLEYTVELNEGVREAFVPSRT